MRFIVYQKCKPIHSSDVMIVYASRCLDSIAAKDSRHRVLLRRFIEQPYLVLTYAEVQTLKNLFIRYGSHDAVTLEKVIPCLISVSESLDRYDACIVKRVADDHVLFYPAIRSNIQYIEMGMTNLFSILRDTLSNDILPGSYSLRPDWRWVSEFIDKPVSFSNRNGYILDGDEIPKLLTPLKLIKQSCIDDKSLNIMLHRVVYLLSKYEDKPVLIVLQPSRKSDWVFALPDGQTV